jgi:hypothetical protein
LKIFPATTIDHASSSELGKRTLMKVCLTIKSSHVLNKTSTYNRIIVFFESR